MASLSIVDSVDGLLLAPMPVPAIPRKSAATWVEATRLTARLQLSPRPTQTKPGAIMPRWCAAIQANQAFVEKDYYERHKPSLLLLQRGFSLDASRFLHDLC